MSLSSFCCFFLNHLYAVTLNLSYYNNTLDYCSSFPISVSAFTLAPPHLPQSDFSRADKVICVLLLLSC